MDAVKKAILGEVLEEEEAYEVMRALMAGEVSPVRAAGGVGAVSHRGGRRHEMGARARARGASLLSGTGARESCRRQHSLCR